MDSGATRVLLGSIGLDVGERNAGDAGVGSGGGFVAVGLTAPMAGWGRRGTGNPPSLLDRIDERRETLNPHFQLVAGGNRPDAAWCAGENDVARQQRQVGRDEADEVEAVEDELAGVRVLP